MMFSTLLRLTQKSEKLELYDFYIYTQDIKIN